MPIFSPEILRRIRESADIVTVVESYGIKLKPTGVRLVGLCPFHREKTGSFNVNSAMQIFKCFGCGKGGDVFKFVQLYENIEFVDAVRVLAQRMGIALEYSKGSEKTAQVNLKQRESRLFILSNTANYFTNQLATNGAEAKDYLSSRGFSNATLEEWKIGYAPANSGLMNYLIGKAKLAGLDNKNIYQIAQELGLIRERNAAGSGDFYEFFYDRVMFPIFDQQGRVIGFGGRLLHERPNAGKYINSPESPLFRKSELLFGLHAAMREIGLRKEAVIVEGYVDAILCHQYGIRHVVATLGTALTEQHAQKLGRYVQNGRVVALFDNDAAGSKATDRATRIFIQSGTSLAVVRELAADCKDAGDFLPKYGHDAFVSCLKNAQPAFSFILQSLFDNISRQDAQAVSRACQEALGIVALSDQPVTRALMRKQIAAAAGVNESDLPASPLPNVSGLSVYGQVTRSQAMFSHNFQADSTTTQSASVVDRLERWKYRWMKLEYHLLEYMLASRDWCLSVIEQHPPNEFHTQRESLWAKHIRDAWLLKGDCNIAELLDVFPDDNTWQEFLTNNAFSEKHLPRSEDDLSELLERIKNLKKEDEEREIVISNGPDALSNLQMKLELQRQFKRLL